jgi:hypothetical protein
MTNVFEDNNINIGDYISDYKISDDGIKLKLPWFTCKLKNLDKLENNMEILRTFLDSVKKFTETTSKKVEKIRQIVEDVDDKVCAINLKYPQRLFTRPTMSVYDIQFILYKTPPSINILSDNINMVAIEPQKIDKWLDHYVDIYNNIMSITNKYFKSYKNIHYENASQNIETTTEWPSICTFKMLHFNVDDSEYSIINIDLVNNIIIDSKPYWLDTISYNLPLNTKNIKLVLEPINHSFSIFTRLTQYFENSPNCKTSKFRLSETAKLFKSFQTFMDFKIINMEDIDIALELYLKLYAHGIINTDKVYKLQQSPTICKTNKKHAANIYVTYNKYDLCFKFVISICECTTCYNKSYIKNYNINVGLIDQLKMDIEF